MLPSHAFYLFLASALFFEMLTLGGGMPGRIDLFIENKRMVVSYEKDEPLPLRESHVNFEVKRLYEAFLAEGPLGHKCYELLYMKYVEK